jgi:hypothetical protein
MNVPISMHSDAETEPDDPITRRLFTALEDDAREKFPVSEKKTAFAVISQANAAARDLADQAISLSQRLVGGSSTATKPIAADISPPSEQPLFIKMQADARDTLRRTEEALIALKRLAEALP